STDQLVEQLGSEVSERYLKNAHVIIACDEDPDELSRTVDVIGALGSAPILPVLTKSDRRAYGSSATDNSVLHVSALVREGLSQLSNELERVLESQYGEIPISRPALT